MAQLRVAVAVVLVCGVGAATGQPTLPDIWKVVEGSYDSKVTVNLPDESWTILVDELYDINEEKGVLEITDRGYKTKTNYYQQSQQTFTVMKQECVVGTLVEHVSYGLWGWIYDDTYSTSGGDNFLLGPSALLRIPRDYPQAEYKGETLVRGIIADLWLINHHSNYSLTYAFAADSWLMPYGHTLQGIDLKAPLQVTVTGMQTNPLNPNAAAIKQTVHYEFMEFKPYVEDTRKRAFLVKDGVDCKNRVTLDPNKVEPPVAPTTFKVFLESVKAFQNPTQSTTVYKAWMYYDNWRQLMRLDMNPDQDVSGASRSYKSIHDYNTGVEYRIDTISGQCVMQPLDPDTLGSMLGDTVGGVIMADPDQLFHLDSSYIFNGYAETRGIKTTRWTSTRADITNITSGNNLQKAVVDYNFIADDVEVDGEVTGTPMPLRMDVSVFYDDDPSQLAYRDSLNLLNMQTSFTGYDSNPFDVGECMDTPADRVWLKITFSGDWFHGAEQEPDTFKRLLVDKIALGTGASYVRFPEVQMDHDTEYVLATVLLLEPAPYLTQFEQLSDRKPTDDDTQLQRDILDEESCARSCLTYPKFTCESFYMCEGSHGCWLSNFKDSDGRPEHVPSDCPHYFKVLTDDDGTFQLPNIDIFVWLKEEIAEGSFRIEIDYINSDGELRQGVYTARSVEQQLLADDPFLVDAVSDDFHVVYQHGRLQPSLVDQTIQQVDYVGCLVSCDGHLSFDCQSFSYCYDSRTCYLSTFVTDSPANSSNVSDQSDCVIASRVYTKDYTKVDGTVYVGDPDVTLQPVSEQECAYQCDTTTTITCRSFDYCSRTYTCNLYSQHTIDEPPEMFNASDSCVHYSRNALVDFEKHENQVLEGNRDRYIKDISVTKCAETCEDQPDFGCDGFDYCVGETETTCFLTSGHYSDQGVEITNDPTCDHYSREYYEGQDRASYAHTKDSKYKYGPGDMAALACSMLVISIAMTFGGIYLYNKHYK